MLSAALNGGASELKPLVGELAADGLRVLAVAERRLTARQAAQAATNPAAMERLCRSQLTAIGLVGLADTLRENSPELLTGLADRGIGVRLVTGDHPCNSCGHSQRSGHDGHCRRGDLRARLGIAGGRRARRSGDLLPCVRADVPEHKVEVVQTLERVGLVTAMVGDGANDAAAIRAATVGIGVAAAGSDPARSAADILLLDGHIEALLDAIDEGEQLWRRVQSAVSVLLGGNLGEVAFALISALASGRSALNARQMLLVNMLTDALPAAARQSVHRPVRKRSTATRRRCGRRSRSGVESPPPVPDGLAHGANDGHATPGLDSGVDRPGLHPTHSDAGGFSRSPGGGDGGRVITDLGDGNQHPGAQPLVRLHADRSAGVDPGSAGHCDRIAGGGADPPLLDRFRPEDSVLQDDQAGSDEDGVEFPKGRGEQPDAGGDDGFRADDTSDIGHTDSQPSAGDRRDSAE